VGAFNTYFNLGIGLTPLVIGALVDLLTLSIVLLVLAVTTLGLIVPVILQERLSVRASA